MKLNAESSVALWCGDQVGHGRCGVAVGDDDVEGIGGGATVAVIGGDGDAEGAESALPGVPEKVPALKVNQPGSVEVV